MVTTGVHRARTRMTAHILQNGVPCQVVRSDAETVVYTGNVIFNITGQRPFERLVAQQIQGRVDLEAIFPYGTDVQVQDVIAANGRRYEVIGYPESATQSAGLIVDCRRVRA
jgi:hypothetical protein